MNEKKTHSFQSEHSPRGAAGSFSLGCAGSGGGFSIESGRAGNQDIYLGYFRDGEITCLPYNRQGRAGAETGMAEFIPTGDPEAAKFPPVNIRFLQDAEIEREYNLATDTWRADCLEFSLVTPAGGIPNPQETPVSVFKDAICPAITGRLVFDNTKGASAITGFFAVGGLKGFRLLEELTGGEMCGLAALAGYGFAAPKQPGTKSFSDMFMDFPFRRPAPNRNFLSGIGGILVEVRPGEKTSLPLAFGWFREGVVTLGKACRYAYTAYFNGLAEVLSYALSREEPWRQTAVVQDENLRQNIPQPARRFLYAKSVRSYWGNTQLFREGNRLRWVVNEGSCNMINTLDLTVDMAFFEARRHPWLLRNVLDAFADEYSYRDETHFPGDEGSHPGGLSFTHDHGFRNVFSPPGYSHYECRNHPACFSYMTCEELLNWLLCAAIYYKAAADAAWLRQRAGLMADCLASMQNRDHPDPAKRNGLMSLDSNRCGRQSEITTYDSLDPSLGQARNNAYMGVKSWAAYLAAAWLLKEDDPIRWKKDTAAAEQSARLAAGAITGAFDEKLGYIPAILEGGDRSAIIPIVESLVYPEQLGLAEAVSMDGPYGAFIQTLKKHLENVLAQGKCLFPDGGWKISANNDNSWMSKIFINQYVAEKILGLPPDPKADETHDRWWREGCARHSVVDQVIAGRVPGEGATYPRSVSAILWQDLRA